MLLNKAIHEFWQNSVAYRKKQGWKKFLWKKSLQSLLLLFLITYYYSFKIFLHFWLAKIPSIIHHNQLLLAKFEEFCNMCTNDVDLSAKLSDYWMVNREHLGMRLSCFVFVLKVQMAQHFTHFTRKNLVNYWLKTKQEQQKDNWWTTSANWRTFFPNYKNP